jgi:hypothetical protein
MIDDSDIIQNPAILPLCFSIVSNSKNDLLKQRHLQDLQMLAKWNK